MPAFFSRLRGRSAEDHVSTLEQAKDLETHRLKVFVIKSLTLLLIASVLTFVGVFSYASIQQGVAPTFSDFTQLVGHLSQVLGVAFGVQ